MNKNFYGKLGTVMESAHRKGFFHLLSSNFFLSFVGLASQLFVANFLSPVDLGRIKTMQSFVLLAVILGGFGLNTAVLKQCSENRPLEDKHNILKENLKLTAACIVLTLIAVTALALTGYLSPDPVINRWMLLYMFSIPSSVLITLYISYLQALKKIQQISYTQTAIRLVGVLGTIIFTYYWKLPGFIFSSVAIGLIALVPFSRITGVQWGIPYDRGDIARNSIYYGKWSVLSNGLNTLGTLIGIFLLNYMVSDRAVLGDFGLAMVLILGMNQVTGTAQSIATPFFSEKCGNKDEFMRVLRKYQRILVLASSAITVLAVAVVPFFVRWAYGGKYPMAGVIFQVLAVRYFFWSCYALPNVALVGLGRMKDNFTVAGINTLIVIVLSAYFILKWGPLGAAYAQAVSGVIALIIVSLNFNRVLKSVFR